MEEIVANDGPDAYRWVVLQKKGDNTVEGVIFTDMKMASDYAGSSEKTFQRRLNTVGNIFSIKGFRVFRLPYYKSKRGRIEK